MYMSAKNVVGQRLKGGRRMNSASRNVLMANELRDEKVFTDKEIEASIEEAIISAMVKKEKYIRFFNSSEKTHIWHFYYDYIKKHKNEYRDAGYEVHFGLADFLFGKDLKSVMISWVP